MKICLLVTKKGWTFKNPSFSTKSEISKKYKITKKMKTKNLIVKLT